jgi:hypothetical protein
MASPPKTKRMKQKALKRTPTGYSKEQESTKNVLKTRLALLQLIHQLQMQALYADSKSRPAFEALTQTLRELFTWVHTMAALHPMSLGALQRRLPTDDAWTKYEAGKHVGAWAGIELARLYRQVQADLKSRSKHAVNRLRDIRYGFKLGNFVNPPNAWFCTEYERKTDYRPTGEMSVWVAQKIEEVRRLKANRSHWRTYMVGKQVRLPSETAEAVLSEFSPSEVVRGEVALKTLDSLPGFGDSGPDGFEAWRKFIRRRVLTNPRLFTEFEQLFPQQRRKLDGVITSTLRSAWKAAQHGGYVILPRP